MLAEYDMWLSLRLSSPTTIVFWRDLVLVVTSLAETGSLLDDVEFGIVDTKTNPI